MLHKASYPGYHSWYPDLLEKTIVQYKSIEMKITDVKCKTKSGVFILGVKTRATRGPFMAPGFTAEDVYKRAGMPMAECYRMIPANTLFHVLGGRH